MSAFAAAALALFAVAVSVLLTFQLASIAESETPRRPMTASVITSPPTEPPDTLVGIKPDELAQLRAIRAAAQLVILLRQQHRRGAIESAKSKDATADRLMPTRVVERSAMVALEAAVGEVEGFRIIEPTTTPAEGPAAS